MEAIVHAILSFYALTVSICVVTYGMKMIADGEVNKVYKGITGPLYILLYIVISPFLIFYMAYNVDEKRFVPFTLIFNSMLLISFTIHYFLHTETSLAAIMILSTIFLFYQTVWVIEIKRNNPKR